MVAGELSTPLLPPSFDLSKVGEFDLEPSPVRIFIAGALSVGGEPSDPWESDSGPSEELPWPESDFEVFPLRNLGMWREIPLD